MKSTTQKFTEEDSEIIENAIASFEVIENMLTKSHSIDYFTTRSQQLDFRDAIEKIRLYLINIQENMVLRND